MPGPYNERLVSELSFLKKVNETGSCPDPGVGRWFNGKEKGIQSRRRSGLPYPEPMGAWRYAKAGKKRYLLVVLSGHKAVEIKHILSGNDSIFSQKVKASCISLAQLRSFDRKCWTQR